MLRDSGVPGVFEARILGHKVEMESAGVALWKILREFYESPASIPEGPSTE